MSLKLVEFFNADKLNHIIQNRALYPSVSNETMVIASKYLYNSHHGQIDVAYHQSGGRGRFFANDSLSLQCLCREIRHTIAREYYVDVDVVNAHPVILSRLCKMNNIECPILDMYVSVRDKVFQKMKLDPAMCKTIILSLTNGGTKDYDEHKDKLEEWSAKFLLSYKFEMARLHETFATSNKADFDAHVAKREGKGESNNHQASYMNILLCEFENKILMSMYDFFKKPANAVLCFDGIMLMKCIDVGNGIADNDINLEQCEAHILATLGITLKLKFKEMNEGFEIFDADMVKYVDPIPLFKQLISKCEDLVIDEQVNDKTIADLFYREHQNSIYVVSDDGNGYVWDESKRLWLTSTSSEIMVRLSNDDGLVVKAIMACIAKYEERLD